MSDEAEEWDGHPLHALTEPQLLGLLAHVPQWAGLAIGPAVPFGNGIPARVSITAIFRGTRDEAEEVMWWHVRRCCARERMEFDEEEWSIPYLSLLHGS